MNKTVTFYKFKIDRSKKIIEKEGIPNNYIETLINIALAVEDLEIKQTLSAS